MNKVIILALFCTIFLAGCQSKDTRTSNSNSAEPILTLESSSTATDTFAEKGSITNPYDGINESFQITCQAPHCGEESETVLEFSNICLIKAKIGWLIHGNITFISGKTAPPIHINDYVTAQYYNKDGVLGFGYYTFFDSDLEGDKEFIFTKNNLIDGSINNLIKFKDLEEQIPEVGCIRYFDGTEYKEVFFLKYEDCKPISILHQKQS